MTARSLKALLASKAVGISFLKLAVYQCEWVTVVCELEPERHLEVPSRVPGQHLLRQLLHRDDRRRMTTPATSTLAASTKLTMAMATTGVDAAPSMVDTLPVCSSQGAHWLPPQSTPSSSPLRTPSVHSTRAPGKKTHAFPTRTWDGAQSWQLGPVYPS
jgi:hypothetical protein